MQLRGHTARQVESSQDPLQNEAIIVNEVVTANGMEIVLLYDSLDVRDALRERFAPLEKQPFDARSACCQIFEVSTAVLCLLARKIAFTSRSVSKPLATFFGKSFR